MRDKSSTKLLIKRINNRQLRLHRLLGRDHTLHIWVHFLERGKYPLEGFRRIRYLVR